MSISSASAASIGEYKFDNKLKERMAFKAKVKGINERQNALKLVKQKIPRIPEDTGIIAFLRQKVKRFFGIRDP